MPPSSAAVANQLVASVGHGHRVELFARSGTVTAIFQGTERGNRCGLQLLTLDHENLLAKILRRNIPVLNVGCAKRPTPISKNKIGLVSILTSSIVSYHNGRQITRLADYFFTNLELRHGSKLSRLCFTSF